MWESGREVYNETFYTLSEVMAFLERTKTINGKALLAYNNKEYGYVCYDICEGKHYPLHYFNGGNGKKKPRAFTGIKGFIAKDVE